MEESKKSRKVRESVKVGQIFGRLTAISISEKRTNGKSRIIICQCECGKITEVRATLLTTLNTKSCGCYGREKVIEANTKPAGEVTLNTIEAAYRKHARNKSREWGLTTEEFRQIILKNCFWCNKEPAPRNAYPGIKQRELVSKETFDRAWINTNGVDRVDNSKGYTKENSVPCCVECNYSKSNRTAKEFFDHCKMVVDHISKKLTNT